MATISNIVIDQGQTFTYAFNLANVDGTPKNLTNYTITAQMRKSYGSASAIDFTTSKVNLEGTITLALTAEETSAIRHGRYVYDVEIESNEETLRVLEGIITVTPEVTRPNGN